MPKDLYFRIFLPSSYLPSALTHIFLQQKALEAQIGRLQDKADHLWLINISLSLSGLAPTCPLQMLARQHTPCPLPPWLPVRRQVSTKPSQPAKHQEYWWGHVENVAFEPSNPNPPAEGKEGETWISSGGWCFSRISRGEAAALPVSAGSHRARARAPRPAPTRSARPGSARAGSISPARGCCPGRHPELFLISLPQNK